MIEKLGYVMDKPMQLIENTTFLIDNVKTPRRERRSAKIIHFIVGTNILK